MKAVKWVLGIVLALVVLLVGAVLAAPYILPMDRLVAEAAARVEQATGRKLTIEGEPKLAIWPEVAIEVDRVAFANAPGAPDPEMATAASARVAVPVLPLLSGEIRLKEFVLAEPTIRLHVDEQGRANWTFGEADAAADAAAPAAAGGGVSDRLRDLRLGDVRIVDGTVVYSDARTGATETFGDVDVTLALASLSDPLALDGALDWRGDRLTLALEAGQPAVLLNGGQTPLRATLEGGHLTASFDGSATFGDGLALEGAARVATPSLKELAAWAAAPLEVEGDVLGPFVADGRLALDGGRIAFTDAAISLDAIEGQGEFAVATGGPKPEVTARLALGPLDLNPYLPAPDQAAANGGGGGAGGWSEEPYDFAALRQANVDLEFAVESLAVRDIDVGRTALAATLREGALVIDLEEMALYGGSGTAHVELDASGETPKLVKTLDLKGVEAQPLLADAADFDRLEGKGDLQLRIEAYGASQAAMARAVDGEGAFVFRDGAVKGFNLAALVRRVESAFLDPTADQQRQTDFSELSASFRIEDGIVRNDDLFMLTPLFRVTGSGQASLPQRTLDYRVVPKAVASTAGQGGAADIAGLAVPVLIAGPWSDLSYAPDLAGVASGIVADPAQAAGAVKDVAKGAAEQAGEIAKEPKRAVEGLLPGGGGADPARQLKGLFGR